MKKFPKLRENLTSLAEDVSDKFQNLKCRIAENVDKIRGNPTQEKAQSDKTTQTSEMDVEEMVQQEDVIPAEQIDVDEDNPMLDLTLTKVYGDDVFEQVILRHSNPQIVQQFKLNGKSSIKKVPFHMALFDSLQILDLSDNHISEIPWSVVYLTKLHTLKLSCNLITVIPKSVCHLSQLKELDISANPLYCLPTELLELKHLSKLNVNDCIYLTSPPLSECLKGLQYIILHLKCRQIRSNLWVESSSWFPHNDPVKSLFTLCIETILTYKVDYLKAGTIPNLIKKELEKAEDSKRYRLSLAKCSQCKGVFTCKETFNTHSCKNKHATVQTN